MRLSTDQSQFINSLYTELYLKLFRYAVNALKSSHLAEEAVQETFCIACIKAKDCMQSPNPEGWIVLTLKNVIRNTIKSRYRLNHLLVVSISGGRARN